MGILYFDAKGGYTDPASSGLKHMRADGQWAAPDADHKFLDATGAWSVPELAPADPKEAVRALFEAAALESASTAQRYQALVALADQYLNTYRSGSDLFQFIAMMIDSSDKFRLILDEFDDIWEFLSMAWIAFQREQLSSSASETLKTLWEMFFSQFSRLFESLGLTFELKECEADTSKSPYGFYIFVTVTVVDGVFKRDSAYLYNADPYPKWLLELYVQ